MELKLLPLQKSTLFIKYMCEVSHTRQIFHWSFQSSSSVVAGQTKYYRLTKFQNFLVGNSASLFFCAAVHSF